MKCRRVRRYLFGYYRGELSPDEAERIKAHLDICLECGKEAKQIESICCMLKDNLKAYVPSQDFDERLLAKVRELPSEQVVKEKRSWWIELLNEIFPSIRLKWALAGAAGVMVVAFAFMLTQKQTSTPLENISQVEGNIDTVGLTTHQGDLDSLYPELMQRVAGSPYVDNKSFVIDNYSSFPIRGEDGKIPLEDLYKGFVIERRTDPQGQNSTGNRYILPVVSTQKVSEKKDY